MLEFVDVLSADTTGGGRRSCVFDEQSSDWHMAVVSGLRRGRTHLGPGVHD